MKLFVFTLISTLLTHTTRTAASSPTINTTHLITTPNFLENIAVRSNNHLLLTSVSTPTIYSLDPSNTSSLYSLPPIPNANSTAGITEIAPDIFAVIAGTMDTEKLRWVLGTVSLWTINLHHTLPVFRHVLNMPEAEGINAITTIPGSPNLVLAADSVAGTVYRIDVKRGRYEVAIKDVLFEPTGPAPSLGINGLHTQASFPFTYLYFTNSALGILGRVRISRIGQAIGPIAVLNDGSRIPGCDDFAIDAEGRAWIATHPASVNLVDGKGGMEVVVNGTGVPDPTSAAFGRGSKAQEGMLYVTTNLLSETGVVGGVVGIDTRSH
ncbi:hypothetical protein K505DRAFT_297794 [Melanomma pulvis-pyrius CBS 109.77]|uniref:SMP-30/Gluconolactonase/LRE-like region domain-containing protein n=1 Tax=Melanomma pulvis-pyrius CBS 109.77 TaxID=1314802 RepID=A0A6A6XQG1_9PLEO|nr:hypothetical protein K505DRAFT_297794 [Melanomma pulvis-pyrius CBS 109.77]